MSPSNPSRKRVLPSWMKNVKSVKSPSAIYSANINCFVDSNNEKKTLSASGENPTNVEEADRISHKSMFVPRNTVLFVMSELELLETARLVLEEDEHSLSPLQQAANDNSDNAEQQQQQQQREEHRTNLRDMSNSLDNARNGLKNQTNLNTEMTNCWDSLHPKQKCTSKRKLDESPNAEDSTDEDAMDVEPSPMIGTNLPALSISGSLSVPDNNHKDSIIHLPNPKIDPMSSNRIQSSNKMPTQKKQFKPNLSVLDEIFF